MRNVLIKKFFLLALVLLFLSSIGIASATAPTLIYVNDALGNDANSGSTAEDPVQTLAKAFSLVTTPATSYRIILAEGQYVSPGEINLPSNSTIEVVSEGGLGEVTVYQNPATPSSPLITVSDDAFTSLSFNNLVLTGDDPDTVEIEQLGTGIYLYSCDRIAGNELLLEGCKLENLQVGIDQKYSDNITVSVYNSFIDANRPITMDYGSRLNVEDSELTMTASDWWYPVISLSGSNININIINNLIQGTSGFGRGIYEDAYTGVISGNTFRKLDIALELDDISNLTVIDNYVETARHGFDLETYFATATITVTGNTVINKGSKNHGATGIKIYTNSNTTTASYMVHNNEMVNFIYGFYYDGYNPSPSMSLSLGGTGLGNTFRGNIFNLYFDDLLSNELIPATGNDWGTTDPQEVLDRIYVSGLSGSEGHSPAEALELDADFSTTALNTIYVDDDYTAENPGTHTYGVDAFSTIQEALPYVRSGGTIVIANGNYSSPLWLDRPVALVGEGTDVVLNPIPNDVYDSTMILVTARNVTIDTLKLSGGHNGISFAKYQLHSYNSRPEYFAVQNCQFSNQKMISIKLSLMDEEMFPGEIKIADNFFMRSEDTDVYSDMPIYIESCADLVTIDGNQVEGNYTSGAYIYTLRDVTVDNNEFLLKQGFSNAGLTVITTGNVLVQDNHIECPDSFNPSYSSTGLSFSVLSYTPESIPVLKQVYRNTIAGFNTGIALSGTEPGEVCDIVIGGSENNANDFSGNQVGLSSWLINNNGEPTNATYNLWGVPSAQLSSYILCKANNSNYEAVDYLPVTVLLPKLSGLAINTGELSPAFSKNTYIYTVNVPNATSSLIITPTASSGVILVNDTLLETESAQVSLSVGLNEIVVKVEEGDLSTTYTINVTREAAEDPDEGTGSSGSSSGSSSSTAPTVTIEETKKEFIFTGPVSATTNIGKATANIPSSLVDALLGKARSMIEKSKQKLLEVRIAIPKDIHQLDVGISQKDFNRIADNTDTHFRINSPFVTVEFDAKAMATIANAGSGGNVVVSASTLDDSRLSEKDRAKVEGRPVYELNVKNGSKLISHFGGGHATVTIPYTLREGENPNSVVIYYLAGDGNLKTVRGHYDATAGAVIFKTPHFSNFVIGHNPVVFSDVQNDAWYKNAVEFLAAQGISTGTGGDNYSPEMKLTRGQFIVMLMKAYQISPAHGSTVNFNDAGNSFYTDYLAEAKRLGIVTGVGNNRFLPEKEITRQEMFVMLYNALKTIDELPNIASDMQTETFLDGGKLAGWAKEATLHLLNSGIVNGSANRLNPTNTTTRAEMAQVIYNLLVN